MTENEILIGDQVIDLSEIGIPFRLNEQQVETLEHLYSFLKDETATTTVLSGSAGTGKSSIVKVLIEFVYKKFKSKYDIILAAPTHKAKSVLNKLTFSSDTQTLHKLLGLKPDVTLEEFDAKDLKFYSELVLDFLPRTKTIFIIDECSMINDFAYDLIVEKLARDGNKVIFIGDRKQLSPVKQALRSKAFTDTNYPGVELTKVMRQVEGNPTLELLSRLRVTSVDTFEQSVTPSSGLYCYTDIREFARSLKDSYVDHDFLGNPFSNKILTYTNARADALNTFVRKMLGRSKFIEEGDLLMGMDSFTPNHTQYPVVSNGSEYVVDKLIKSPVVVPYFGDVPGYSVTLYDTVDECFFKIPLIDPNINPRILNNLAYAIENARLNAIDTKNGFLRKRAWERWYTMCRSFMSFSDLVYMGRIIKKAGFSYGYAMTVHKS